MSRALGIALAIRYAERPYAPLPQSIPAERSRSDVRERPAAPMRWVHKLRRAVPASLAVFRRQVGAPAYVTTTDVGTRVVSRSGRYVGAVEEVFVGVREGRTTIAVSASSLPREWILLVPERSLETGPNDALVLTDPKDTVAVPRELTAA